MKATEATPGSVRLPAELLAALRRRAEEDGRTISDGLRSGALMLLGFCPTCGQKTPAADGEDSSSNEGSGTA